MKYVLDCIEKEQRLNQGSTGKKKTLSYKEKFRLVRDFLDLRANPQKNRLFQSM